MKFFLNVQVQEGEYFFAEHEYTRLEAALRTGAAEDFITLESAIDEFEPITIRLGMIEAYWLSTPTARANLREWLKELNEEGTEDKPWKV